MGLRTGWRAKIWAVEKREKCTIVEMSTSTKNKEGTYETDWSCKRVMLVGDAHEVGVRVGDFVEIGDFEVRNKFDKERNQLYTDYKVFDLKILRRNGETVEDKPKKEAAPKQEDDELPFD